MKANAIVSVTADFMSPHLLMKWPRESRDTVTPAQKHAWLILAIDPSSFLESSRYLASHCDQLSCIPIMQKKRTMAVLETSMVSESHIACRASTHRTVV